MKNSKAKIGRLNRESGNVVESACGVLVNLIGLMGAVMLVLIMGMCSLVQEAITIGALSAVNTTTSADPVGLTETQGASTQDVLTSIGLADSASDEATTLVVSLANGTIAAAAKAGSTAEMQPIGSNYEVLKIFSVKAYVDPAAVPSAGTVDGTVNPVCLLASLTQRIFLWLPTATAQICSRSLPAGVEQDLVEDTLSDRSNKFKAMKDPFP